MDYKAYESGQVGESFWDIADRELKEIMLNECKTEKNAKILNIGCGTGEDTELIKKYGEVYLLDINKDALELIPKHLYKEKKIADATKKIPYSDNFFDIIVMFGSIEHMEDDKKAIKEARRVLKNDGYLLLTGPAYQWLYSAHDKALLHFRRYNKKQLRILMKEGFKEKILSYWNSVLFIPIAFLKVINKNKEPKLHSVVLPKYLDRILLFMLRLDNKIAKQRITVPIGANFYGIYQKK